MLTDPLDVSLFLRKRRTLKRDLTAGGGLQPLRIAVLGGVTTSEVVASLEVLLMARGFLPEFHQSEYGRFYEDAVLDAEGLMGFAPQLVYLCTSNQNLRHRPAVLDTPEQVTEAVEQEMARFRQVWDAISAKLPSATILQNNFEPWSLRPLGSLEGAAAFGGNVFLHRMNLEVARASQSIPKLVIVDQHQVAAHYGISNWFSATHWHGYKMAQTPEAAVWLANAVASLTAALYGRTKKCLVLDLDNTLWGGVIGDDGVERIQLGRETPVAEAYTAFQDYCLRLRRRGILLAVCSKNEDANARLGFQHPDTVLSLADFSSFQANWESKDQNIRRIAAELNIGLDSLVFVDDNPAERALVRGQLPMVAVPEVGADVARYPEILDQAGYFEVVSLSPEDAERARLYADNAQRRDLEQSFASYGDYLASLEMTAEIRPFSAVYLDRIAQLTNKSNQFNLTTRRYSRSELEAFSTRPDCVTLYGRLADRFGDNGLVTVVMGFLVGDTLEIDLWLMSCRVLKRDLELAMLDHLVTRARALGARRLLGRYLRTTKNGMVAGHYEALGFSRLARAEDGSSSEWELLIASYQPRTLYIKEMHDDTIGDLDPVTAGLP